MYIHVYTRKRSTDRSPVVERAYLYAVFHMYNSSTTTWKRRERQIVLQRRDKMRRSSQCWEQPQGGEQKKEAAVPGKMTQYEP